MKNRKGILIAVIIVIVLALVLVLCKACKKDENVENPNINIDNVEVNPYVKEFENEKYEGRILEADTKEYITLFIETKLYEGKEVIEIVYDSEKYVLDRANPLVGNILPESVEGSENKKSFQVELDPITNYSVDFIKKNVQSKPASEDVDLR